MAVTVGHVRARNVEDEARRTVRRARNAARMLLGNDPPAAGVSPREVVWQRGKAQLFRYSSGARERRQPLVIVWSIVSRPYILDLRPRRSFIAQLRDAGFDVFLLDWGRPDALDAGSDLARYVDRCLPSALNAALECSGKEQVDVLGYCFGGVLALLGVAGHQEVPVRRLVTVATPVDFSQLDGVFGALSRGRIDIADLLDEDGNVPPKVISRAIASLRPTGELFHYARLWDRLWDDNVVAGARPIAAWIEDQVAVPGAVAREVAELFLRDNLLLAGEVPLGERLVRLDDVACPVLNVLAEQDHMVPAASSEPLERVLHGAEVTEARLAAGHIGLAAGRDAARITVPAIMSWLTDGTD